MSIQTNQVPWIQLGTKLDRPETAEEAIRNSGLDYEVRKRPLKATIQRRLQIDVPNNFATVRMDTVPPRSLGIVGNRYEILQNTECFKFFDPIVDRSEAIYETCGIIDGGKAIWLLAKLPGYLRIGKKGDPIEKYLLLVNSHDGTSQVRIKTTAIRVVCKNSLTTALKGSEQEIRIRHTATASIRLEEAHKLLGIWNALYEELNYIFNRMSYKQVNSQQVQKFVETLIPDNKDAENNTRTENMRNRILELHENGIGADIHRGTTFGLYNGVTEFVDHQESKDPNKHLKSIWFGSGEQLKRRAYQLAESML